MTILSFLKRREQRHAPQKQEPWFEWDVTIAGGRGGSAWTNEFKVRAPDIIAAIETAQAKIDASPAEAVVTAVELS